VAADQGWQAGEGRWSPKFRANAGERIDTGDLYAGEHGHGEITWLTVSQLVDEADIARTFRQALAGAVAVLGHPPLVGDEDGPFARWRGARVTLTLAAPKGGTVQLMVEPTEPRERVIYNAQKWMMEPDDWRPDELWATEPDVEAPQAGALLGMHFYEHSPSTTIDEVVDELRSLFRSWCEVLPLLYPYASSVRWRLRPPGGGMIAEGGFTHERVTAQFGRSHEFGEPVTAAPGAAAAADLVERVNNALVLAGITSPEQLRGAAWSDTPAERLNATRLTLQYD
jgi:hypothetical protein